MHHRVCQEIKYYIWNMIYRFAIEMPNFECNLDDFEKFCASWFAR